VFPRESFTDENPVQKMRPIVKPQFHHQSPRYIEADAAAQKKVVDLV
jgi:hypothetical protein